MLRYFRSSILYDIGKIMYLMLKQHFAIWQKHFYLACGLYGVCWLFGIMVTLRLAPQQTIQQLLIAPGQTHDAWYYISHNIGVEGVLLLGACTFGIGTGLILCINGLLDGILATAIARHYGLGVLLAGLLPHGFFEACAWILISTCGFLLSGHFKRIISSLWHNKSIITSEQETNMLVETQTKTTNVNSSIASRRSISR